MEERILDLEDMENRLFAAYRRREERREKASKEKSREILEFFRDKDNFNKLISCIENLEYIRVHDFGYLFDFRRLNTELRNFKACLKKKDIVVTTDNGLVFKKKDSDAYCTDVILKYYREVKWQWVLIII